MFEICIKFREKRKKEQRYLNILNKKIPSSEIHVFLMKSLFFNMIMIRYVNIGRYLSRKSYLITNKFVELLTEK